MFPQVLEFLAIGTTWRIETHDVLSPALAAAILARVEVFDATYSRFRPDSLVSGLRRTPGTVAFPPEAAALLALYRRLYDATDGAITPLVGATLEHLGYDPAYVLRQRPGAPPPVPAWDDVMTVEANVVTTSAPVVIDLGAAGKGFLVDLIGVLLDEAGVAAYVIDGSGDLLCRRAEIQRIGLQDPMNRSQAVGLVTLTSGALCASSITGRTWGPGLHHVINPATGEPSTDMLATWVTSPTCAEADGLATALLLVEPDRLSPHFDFSYARLHTDRSADWADTFLGELFT